MDTADFDYELPDAAIAQSALPQRHASRVLVGSDLSEVPFLAIDSLLCRGDLLVVNTTRVRAARLLGVRVPTGGTCELLLTKHLEGSRWQALAKGSKRLRAGSVVQCGTITATVVTDPRGGVVTVDLATDGDMEDAIEREGVIPLPPYFHGSLSSQERYQTMFATHVGSSASPTAALHFTPEVLLRIEEKGVEMSSVELQVGLDTFRPMGDGEVEDHQIHSERIVIGLDVVEAIRRCRERAGRVIAVGTTVVRALESAGQTATLDAGHIGEYVGETDLFISPGYRFGVVDGLFTNFHAPRTTLLVMIASIVGERWRDIYAHALAKDFRFLSFGDAMYVKVDR